MSNLSNDYDVRLATLKKLGGDMSKKYATIYDVDLAILEKIGQGGGVSIEEVDAEIDSKLTGYATESWVESKGYLTENQALENYATKEELNSKLDVTEIWTGTQAEWDLLSADVQNSIKIAIITE